MKGEKMSGIVGGKFIDMVSLASKMDDALDRLLAGQMEPEEANASARIAREINGAANVQIKQTLAGAKYKSIQVQGA